MNKKIFFSLLLLMSALDCSLDAMKPAPQQSRKRGAPTASDKRKRIIVEDEEDETASPASTAELEAFMNDLAIEDTPTEKGASTLIINTKMPASKTEKEGK